MLAYYLHNLDPIIFRISENVGPRWYGLAYVLAFICSYFLFLWLAKRGFADLRPQQVGDFITGCALFGVIIGGRLGYVFFYKPEMLREPLSIFRVWEGGMSSHGGMLGLLLFTLYYAHRHKISWTNLGDNLVVTAPIGLFFGRCANFINGELYDGVLTGLFFICYAIFRIVVEYFREPDATLIGPFTRGQFFSFFLIAIGLGFVGVAKMRPTFPRGRNDK